MAARVRILTDLLADLALAADLPAFTTSTRPTKAQAIRALNLALYQFSHKHKYAGTRLKQDNFAVSSGSIKYQLPDDFVSLVALRYDSGGQRRKVVRGTVDDLDASTSGNAVGWARGGAKYVLGGGLALTQEIYFTDPRASYVVDCWYVPEIEAFDTNGTAQAELSADTDQILSAGGVDQWAVLSAAIEMKGNEEQDTAELERRLDRVEQGLTAHLRDREPQESAHVRNVDGGWGDGDGDELYR